MTEAPADRCRRYRRRILEISQQVQAAHVAPAFSCLEIVDALYHEVMRPQDVFIMSKGHGCLAQYVVLEDLRWERERECKVCGGSGFSTPGTGYGDVCGECGGQRYSGPRVLDLYCRPGGALGAHPDYAPGIGIHASTGSLGHGLGIAAGQALAEKIKGSDVRVYVLLSDGECQEGSTWEVAMVAANLGLDNLVALVDRNDFGGMDRMSEVHPALDRSDAAQRVDASLWAKFLAFGWAAAVVDGHHSAQVVRTIELPTYGQILLGPARPRAVICRTTKGKGISFMESAPLWHYRSPPPEGYRRALAELGGTGSEEAADAAQGV